MRGRTDEAGHGELSGLNFGWRKLLQAIRFADGMVTDTKTGLQRIMDRLTATAEKYEMKLNTNKDKSYDYL